MPASTPTATASAAPTAGVLPTATQPATPTTVTPSVSWTAVPSVTPAATPPAAPTATPEEPGQTADSLLASIERSVEVVRGITTPPPVEHMFVDQAGMQERLAEELSDPEVVEQIVHESALLKLLGVIPQDSDLGAIYESMLGGQVLGLYDPEKEQFFVLGDDRSGADSIDVEAQLTYAHEYVHRLQDAEFDLEALEERTSGDDMSIAVSALVEGDATTAQTQYMIENFDFMDLVGLLESAVASEAELPASPYFLQRGLEFPYVEGAAFVAELVGAGGFEAVDGAYVDLPRSTEHVLHPEKFFADEVPVELDVPDDAMGSEWSVQVENVLGEFFLKTWLEALGSGVAGVALAGWGGDAYAVFEDGAGGLALGVVIAWDTDPDALEFFDAASDALDASDEFAGSGAGLPGLLEAWAGPGGFVVMSRWSSDEYGDVVAIGIAPDGASSQALVTALAGG
ncbi:MAG: hypothetical protein QF357_04175 [Dehalococcoidia bacterium]|nr:hypothetical protein [Dehalococcoidia bacterium]